MKILFVARKTLLEAIREPQLLLLVLAAPLSFVLLTAAIYNTPLLSTYPLIVISLNPSATALVQELKDQHYADGCPVFEITQTTGIDSAEKTLKDHKTSGLVIISPDESRKVIQVTIKGDALYQPFYKASTILDSVLARYADKIAGRPEVVKVIEHSLGTGGPQDDFDVYAPGMIIFALLMLIPQTAFLVAREIRWGTLRRLRLTQLSAFEYLGGVGLAQMIFAVFLVIIVFMTAILLGFHNQGSFLLATIIGLALCLSAIGQGLIVACFVENDSQANNVGSTVTMFEVFMSGSFYAIPPMTLFTLAGHQIDLFDIIPATHGFLALQQVLTYGAGFQEIGFRLGAILVLSLLYFILGTFIFQRWQMRRKG